MNHVLGIVAAEGNLSLSIDGPFARLEYREFLLRLCIGAYHVVC